MAGCMPRPLAHRTGVYCLNVRIPSDIAEKVRKTSVSLPVDGSFVTVKATDKIFLSRRTKDPVVAKQRLVEAFSALNRHFDACRAGPPALPHKQIVALAGEIYAWWVRFFEDDPQIVPDDPLASIRAFEREVDVRHCGDGDEFGEMSEGDARFLASIAQPWGLDFRPERGRPPIDAGLENHATEHIGKDLRRKWFTHFGATGQTARVKRRAELKGG